MTQPSRPSIDDSLARIRALLDKQELVRGLVHKTEMRRHEVVEDLVARQYHNELRRQINHLHPADIAHLLETLRTDERPFAQALPKSDLTFANSVSANHVPRSLGQCKCK